MRLAGSIHLLYATGSRISAPEGRLGAAASFQKVASCSTRGISRFTVAIDLVLLGGLALKPKGILDQGGMGKISTCEGR